jgi:hypothetical protein
MLILMSSAGLGILSGQSVSDTMSNAFCIERLQMPYYPPLADHARISGIVTAIVSLAADGSVQDTTMDMGAASATAKHLFPPAVRDALRASTFHKGCDGKPVTLIFHFGPGEEADPRGRSPTISFGYPNQFWISFSPMIAQP